MKFSTLSLLTLLGSTSAFTSFAPARRASVLLAEGDDASSMVPAKYENGALTSPESMSALVAFAEASNPVVNYFDPLNLASFEGGFWEQGQEATIGFLRH